MERLLGEPPPPPPPSVPAVEPDIRDLKAILASNSRQLARNLLHQFTLYATGTPVRFADRGEIETILDRCATDGYRVRDLLHAFVQSRGFLGKTGE